MTWGDSCRGPQPRRAKRAIRAGLALAFGMALIPTAQAQSVGAPVVSSTTVRAAVVSPLSVIKIQDMDFGQIVPSPAGGTVSVNAVTSACSVTGTVREVGTCRYAQFTGMGTRNMNARISLSSVVNLTGPGQPMQLDQLVLGTNNTISLAGNTNSNGNGVGLTQGNGNAARYRIISSSGIYLLNIGGRLTINPNQTPGAYRGTFTISVQYQ